MMASMRVPPTTTATTTATKPTWAFSSLRSFSPPLPAAAEQDEEQEDSSSSSKPATSAARAAKPPSSSEFSSPAHAAKPLGRAPTAATAVFALARDGASRPAACTRVDLATKLLDADHAMSTPTYTREYLVRGREGGRERERESGERGGG